MTKFILTTACACSLALASFGAWAQSAEPAAPAAPAAPTATPAPDCAARAADKKLAGAALNSFMKKCERDAATASCTVAATEKKLAGAARTSFTKKCVKDAITPPGAQ
jgi:hypothetical protein